VIVGFGTSAPELVVSGLAAYQGNPGLALGNAYGSNITNIALILAVTALIRPLTVHSRVLHGQLPLLAVVTALAAWQLRDGFLSRSDALVLLGVFAALMGWTVRQGLRRRSDALGLEMERELEVRSVPDNNGVLRLVVGLVLLIASSRILVWGAVGLARGWGIGDLVIGLTVVAVGTSLPELASSVAATRRGENEIALGNVIGSNLFNTLAVVGFAGTIRPMTVAPVVLERDVLVMALLTISLFLAGFGFRGPGRINRIEALAFLTAYTFYTSNVVGSVLGK
jgi:cation:H+ antiporter